MLERSPVGGVEIGNVADDVVHGLVVPDVREGRQSALALSLKAGMQLRDFLRRLRLDVKTSACLGWRNF
jgi:hypothetical protein